MRKSKRNILLSTCAALLLAGCVDASAKLPNSQEVLMTIGKNNVTKGTIYSQMLNSNGSNIAYNEAKKVIAGLEVEVTDDNYKMFIMKPNKIEGNENPDIGNEEGATKINNVPPLEPKKEEFLIVYIFN